MLRNVIHPHPSQPGDGEDFPRGRGHVPLAWSIAQSSPARAHATPSASRHKPFLGGDFTFMSFCIREASPLSPVSSLLPEA